MFSEPLEQEIQYLFQTNAKPTQVYNTLMQTKKPGIAALIPQDFSVKQLQIWYGNHMHGPDSRTTQLVCLNDLAQWMVARQA